MLLFHFVPDKWLSVQLENFEKFLMSKVISSDE